MSKALEADQLEDLIDDAELQSFMLEALNGCEYEYQQDYLMANRRNIIEIIDRMLAALKTLAGKE